MYHMEHLQFIVEPLIRFGRIWFHRSSNNEFPPPLESELMRRYLLHLRQSAAERLEELSGFSPRVRQLTVNIKLFIARGGKTVTPKLKYGLNVRGEVTLVPSASGD